MARGSAASRRPQNEGDSKAPEKAVIATNRKARHTYVIEDSIEAGLQLLGSEVKSLRNGSASLTEGYARIAGGELWLYGVHIPPLPQAARWNHEPVRRRKCLVHKRELKKLERFLQQDGRTLVPLSLHFRGVHVKVDLGLARGRRKVDKRHREREKEDHRAMRQAKQRSR